MESPERFRQIEEVFDAAADVPPEDRPAVLDRLCASDPKLRSEVESLLAAMVGAASQIRHAVGGVAATMGPGLGLGRMGPYRLVRELGRGGMGAVYLAVRDDDEYRNQVAIKLIQGGLSSEQEVARFRDERQILATLDHPGIVHLLDGGRTEEQLPYLVMEYVVGEPITRWAEAHGLDIRARVELFRKACSAVAYAHQKLVVHRDLKPGNILVTPEGEPKLLDFGIAKLMDPAAGREALTRPGMLLLTPEYASPEQLRGEPVSTSSDVYALGAVLYELLTGRPAQQVKGQGVEALRALLEVDPPSPSAVAPAARRRAVAGDLDSIVTKALRKEAPQRYASVDQFSGDLERYLQGLPVAARSGTWTYRAGKMLRRNRGAIGAVGVVLVALTTATGFSLLQARRADAAAQMADQQAHRAQRRFDEVRRLANSLLFEVDGKIARLEGATEARELIVRRALEYLDGLVNEASDDPALSRELAAAYRKIGDIQGNPLMPNLGHPKDGLASFAKAKLILDGLPTAARGEESTRWEQARILQGIGLMHHALDERGPMKEVMHAWEGLVSSLPESAEYDYALVARGHSALANQAAADNDIPLGLHQAEGCLDVATRWAKRSPTSSEARYWTAVCRENRGEQLGQLGEPGRAAEDLGASAGIMASLLAAEPDSAAYRRELWFTRYLLAVTLSGIGNVQIWHVTTGDRAAAEGALREDLPVVERMSQHDPNDIGSVLDLVSTLDTLGVLVGDRDPQAAMPLFKRARETFAGLPLSVRTPQYANQCELFGQCAMAVSLAMLDRESEALAASEVGLAIAKGNAAIPSSTVDDRMSVFMCEFEAAKAEGLLGHARAGAALLRDAAAGFRPILAPRPSGLMPYVGLVQTLELLAKLEPATACASYDEAISSWRSWPGAATSYTSQRLEELEAERSRCR